MMLNAVLNAVLNHLRPHPHPDYASDGANRSGQTKIDKGNRHPYKESIRNLFTDICSIYLYLPVAC
jgi:hypothetical protein